MKKLLYIAIPIMVIAAGYVGLAAYQTATSISFFHTIQKDIRDRDFNSISHRIHTDALFISEHSIFYKYGNRDVTYSLSAAKPDFIKIFEFYLTDPERFQARKVIFTGPWITQDDDSKRKIVGNLYHDHSGIVSAKLY